MLFEPLRRLISKHDLQSSGAAKGTERIFKQEQAAVTRKLQKKVTELTNYTNIWYVYWLKAAVKSLMVQTVMAKRVFPDD
jgi:hypothetical protein